MMWITVGLFIFVWLYHSTPVLAQGSRWNPPTQLHSSDNFVNNPILVSDDSGRLHLFWSEITPETNEAPQQSLIYYMVKDQGIWSGPVDILAGELDSITTLRATLDKFGQPFLLIGGNNNPLYYSHALQADPLDARSWMPLRSVSGRQTAGDILVGDAIHMVYGDLEGQIHYQRLRENGAIESSQIVAVLPNGQLIRYPPQMIRAADGTLHVVLPAITPPDGDLATYYFRSTDDGATWSELRSISYPDRSAFSLEEDLDGNLHILFIGRSGVGGRHHIVSTDGGESWSEPKIISYPEEGTGLSGGDLATDSANRLHAVLGLENDAIVVHSEFDGTNWKSSETISRGVAGQLEQMGLEITHGNRLHAVWQADHSSIWYAEGSSTAPAVEVKGLASVTTADIIPTPTIKTGQPEEILSQTNSPNTLSGGVLGSPPSSVSNVDSLIIAIGASLLFIVLIVTFRRLFSRR